VGRAAAELLRARARAVVAQKKLARQLALDKEGATSQNAVDEARADALVAEADLAAARTLLFQLGAGEPSSEPSALGIRVAVRAPIDGVVVRRHAVLGGAVTPDHALFEIVAKERTAVLAAVPEGAEVPPVGTAARLYPRATTGECEAVVSADLGVVEGATRARSIRVEAKGACPFLVTGGWVEVGLATAVATTTPVLVVPAEAVVEVHGVPVVFVLAAEGATIVFRPRTVRLGPSVGLDAVVEDGVGVGERVAVGGTLLLKGELLRSELE
jgi:cobalt-zinc-cadmium efflux system membrane fusion protein